MSVHDIDGAEFRAHESDDHCRAGVLPAPLGPKQADHLAAGDFEVDSANHLAALVGFPILQRNRVSIYYQLSFSVIVARSIWRPHFGAVVSVVVLPGPPSALTLSSNYGR